MNKEQEIKEVIKKGRKFYQVDGRLLSNPEWAERVVRGENIDPLEEDYKGDLKSYYHIVPFGV